MSSDVLAPVEFREERFEIEGRERRYLVAGEGPTIVFIHGIGGLRRAPTHDLVARDYRVVLIELPGFEVSPRDEEPPPFKEYVSVVREMISAATGSPHLLVGTSFGAHVAVAVAAGSDDVEGLVLLAPVILTDGMRLPGPDDPPPSLLAHPERVHLAPIDPAQRVRQLTLAQEYLANDLSDVVRALTGPTLVAFGTADEAVLPTLGRRYVELNPDIFLSFFYDSGHLIEFDRPEALANLIRNFAKYKRDFHLVRESGLLFP